MPSYQCPRCRNPFSVDSDDAAIAECPRCRAAEEEQTWYYKLGDETVGPVSRVVIDRILGAPIQIRQGDGEWQSSNDAAQPADEQSADLKATRSESPVTRVLTVLVLLAAAVSGWAYHFAVTHRNAQSPNDAVSKHQVAKSSDQKPNRPKPARSNAKSVNRRTEKKAGQPKPRLTAKVEDLRMEIQPIDQQPQQVIVQVTVQDPAVWQQVRAMLSVEKLADLITLREMSDRELKAPSKRMQRIRRRRGPDHGPIFGTVRMEGRSLQFRPAANLLPGERYKATFDPSVLGPKSGFPPAKIEKTYTVGPARPRLVAIHPLTRELPVNIDRFHIIFTEPMQREHALSHFRLRNPTKVDEDIDLKPLRPTLLWSKDGRRCTIQFDTKLSQSMPILKSGIRYRLTLSGEWKSAHGLPLGSNITKFFSAVKSDKRGPEPAKWTVNFPKRSGKPQPIRCKMRERIDWVSWNAEARIVDADGRLVDGRFAFLSGGTVWNFYPAAAWKGGDYRLRIGHQLRDLSGNIVTGEFKSDPTDPNKNVIEIPFHVRGGK